MKRTNRYLLLMLSILTIGMQSCKKTTSEIPTVDYTVTISYPETYGQTKVNNAKVTLTNSTTNSKLTVNTNTEGVATFAKLLPGNYQISVEKSLTAAEALPLTGIEVEAFLNASATNQLITANINLNLKLSGSAIGGLVFKQIYYTGSRTAANGMYLTDQFYEIYNNSTEVQYADSLYLGESGGNAKTSASTAVFGFDKAAGNVYLVNVWMVPGTGKSHPIQPGQSIVIASNAIHHKTDPAGNPNSIDLGKGISDFEGYVAATGRDTDNPDVPNMELVQYGLSTFTWNTAVFGPSMVIFKSKDVSKYRQLVEPNSTNTTRLYMEVPGAVILDAVEANANATAITHKRFPSALDAGFQFCSGTYVREAIVRKVRTTVNGRRVLQDTNNSTEDFTLTTNILPKGWL